MTNSGEKHNGKQDVTCCDDANDAKQLVGSGSSFSRRGCTSDGRSSAYQPIMV
jgi:hypothetical protein